MADDKGYYRPIYTAIWDDEDFRSFDTNTKLVFFNLRVNRFGNFPCIYVCYLDTVASQTGLPLKAVKKAIDTLSDRQWIAYQYPIMWVIKALKNDPNWSPNNQKQVKGVVDIIKSLPKSEIVAKFITYYKLDIGYRYPIDSPSIPYGIGYGSTETETETETDKEKEKEREAKSAAEKGPPLLPSKLSFGEFGKVLLTDEEHKKLNEKFGEEGTKDRITDLDTAIESKGLKYKSHYATILNWDRRNSDPKAKNKIKSKDEEKKRFLELIGEK